MSTVNREEIDIEVSERVQDQYTSLLKEARKQMRDASEDISGNTKREIRVKNNAIIWRIKVPRVLFFLWCVPIPFLLLLLPFIGIYSVQAEGRIPLPEEYQEEKSGLFSFLR